MNEGLNVSTKPGRSKHETVNKGPIRACIGTFDNFRNKRKDKVADQKPKAQRLDKEIRDIFQNKDTKNVDWFRNQKDAFVVSDLDGFNKFSEGFTICFGIVVTGIEKGKGKNISFLSHQAPKASLSFGASQFVATLNKRLLEVVERCEPGTIDAVIVGGVYSETEPNDSGYSYAEEYLDSVELLRGEVQNVLGLDPVVINGPKTNLPFSDRVYYDTNHRRLYFIRPKVNQATKSSADFPASDAPDRTGEWQELKAA